ncbi:unnamed protein product [Trichobilharzia szidati]|nr:unnamed protein product [Trichobilharzia szidati]
MDDKKAFFTIPLGSNNSADSTPPPSHTPCLGGKRMAQTLLNKHANFIPSYVGINFDTVNRQFPPIECNTGCNVGCNLSNLEGTKLNPTHCAQLSVGINEQAVKLRLRSEVPHLTRKDITKLRLPFYEILCYELLQHGYHYAFTELFNLYQRQIEERQKAGPESTLWFIPPLSEQPEKLRLIAEYLVIGEAASRRVDDYTECNAYMMLGLALRDNPDDLWVAEYFLRHALSVAERIHNDDGLKLAKANQYYGLILQSQGEYAKALNCFQQFYNLTMNKQWTDDNGELLKKLATNYLVQNYHHLIDNCDPAYYSDRVNYCKSALDVAIQSKDWLLEAETRLKMGKLQEDAKRYDDAIQYYLEYFEAANQHDDHISLGKACEALADIYQKRNQMKEAILYLHKFATLCERHGQWAELSRACQLLGTAYDSVGEYACALKWMKKAYNLPNMIPSLKQNKSEMTMESARIMLGVSRAHLMNRMFVTAIINNTPNTILKLCQWKADPKDESELFASEDCQVLSKRLVGKKPYRDVIVYSKNPVSGFNDNQMNQ